MFTFVGLIVLCAVFVSMGGSKEDVSSLYYDIESTSEDEGEVGEVEQAALAQEEEKPRPKRTSTQSRSESAETAQSIYDSIEL